MRHSRLPVTVLYGLPGAGKTTLSAYLLGRQSNLRIQISQLRSREAALDAEGLAGVDADYLLLEAGGVCEPELLAARLTPASRAGVEVADAVRLDSMVTVIDAASFLADFSSWARLTERYLDVSPADDRAVADALAENIEFADVVVLNKIDAASPTARRNGAMLIRALNPDAVIVESEFGRVPPHKVLSTHSFEYTRAQSRARWIRVMAGHETASSDSTEARGFLYEARRPFHPQRLMQFVRSAWPGVIRCRGYFWLATRMDWMGELSQAGPSRRYRPSGSWWASLIGGREVDRPLAESFAGAHWDFRFGDRRQQLAFVGLDLDESALRTCLDACLLDDGEWLRGPEVWQTYEDPFPSWGSSAPLKPPGSTHLN